MLRRRWVRSILFVLGACCWPVSALAHPLGNFTINHLVKVTPSAKLLHVRYVLDIAEIPAFQIMRASSSNGIWNNTQLERWAQSELPVIRAGVDVEVDGSSVALVPHDVHAAQRPGAGGLSTLYLVADFTAAPGAGSHHISVRDNVYADRRIGWRDIVVASQSEPTNELRSYPPALVGSPRRVDEASFDLSSSGRVSLLHAEEAASTDSSGSSSLVRTNALSDMFSSSNRAPLFVLFTALVAFGLGALHAIEPGHGKALLAFTLVGSRATVKQAIILAASLTFAHTIGVLLLGVVLFFAAGFVSESIYPWITLGSGAAVAIIGARNLSRYFGTKRLHAHGGTIHAHGFTNDHHHGDEAHGHSHAVPGTGPIDFRGAIVAAMSGGIAPCPAAIVVMLAALRLHQLGYGIILIVIFSLGLACVLSALGIAVVHGSGWLSRTGKFDRLVAAGPLLSSVVISAVGAIMVGQGFLAQGVPAPLWAVAALTLLAIAGYALAPAHVHARATEPS